MLDYQNLTHIISGMENRKKSIEQLQAELALESEALGTLQIIYADKVKQVRTNTTLPSDIQARFLAEWETFYQQRVSSIFRKEYRRGAGERNSAILPVSLTPQPAAPPIVAPAVAEIERPSSPLQPPPALPPQQVTAPVSPPVVPPVIAKTPPPPVMPKTPPMMSKTAPPAPPMPPSLPKMALPNPPPEPPPAKIEAQSLNEDILGVNTDSWMNVAESISYEQYENEPIAASLMDSDKVEAASESLEGEFNEDDSIDGYAATTGLKGLTEFMDFDLKRKKS